MAFETAAGIAVVELDNTSGTPVAFQSYMKGVPGLETTLATPDATSLADLATKFVFGLEDGGEVTVDIMLDNAAPSVAWTHLTALYNARYVGTLAVYPSGKVADNPKISREVGITKMGVPITNDDVTKCSVTFKANGATTMGVHT